MSGVDQKVVTVKKLLEGNYVFKLTVTDDKGLTGSDVVAVNVNIHGDDVWIVITLHFFVIYLVILKFKKRFGFKSFDTRSQLFFVMWQQNLLERHSNIFKQF